MNTTSPPESSPIKSEVSEPQSGIWAEFRELFKTLIVAILFAIIFRSFVYEPFHIPSDSMKSGLLVGDYLFVSKFSYGYSRYSFPFFGYPHVPGRFLATAPKRGDVVVFRPPGKPSDDYIKRLIGLPGDRIQMRGGILYINDKPSAKEYVDEWTDPEPDGVSGSPVTYKRYRETLPEGKSFMILNRKYSSSAEDTEVFTVPEDHYFMMGDNRDDSHDSRFTDGGNPVVGYVPAENLVGRADMILFSWYDLVSFRTDRFFKKIP